MEPEVQTRPTHASHPHTVLPARTTAGKVGLCVATIWKKVAANEFPKPIRLGANRVGWIEAEIDRWIDARITERDQRGVA